jgi:hypothetical protein
VSPVAPAEPGHGPGRGRHRDGDRMPAVAGLAVNLTTGMTGPAAPGWHCTSLIQPPSSSVHLSHLARGHRDSECAAARPLTVTVAWSSCRMASARMPRYQWTRTE